MWFICLLIGLMLGALAVYVVQKPKLKTIQQLDEKTAQANQALQIELASLTARKDEILTSMANLEKQAQEAGQKFMEQNRQIAEVQFEQSAEAMAHKFQQHQKSYEDEYLLMMQEMSADVASQLEEYREELTLLENQIADKQAIVAAAVEASKRAAEMEKKVNFYRLNLTNEDISEITKLREVLPYLRNSEPLNKVIWKVYYEKPYTDLIGRVVGTGVHTGIYKITNIENQMCYVGQSVNIADRFKQHIKRGIGAEAPTRNKLYSAMLEKGVENFTFEIVEECERSKLNDREDYWQEFFHAKDFGYSIK